MPDLAVGSTIAGCRLDAVAGRGGMGVVYRATQLALDRTVALKAIAPRFAQDAAFRERFQRESHLAASIEHTNVIPVYEAGELDGTLFLIMRWVDGTDLRALISDAGRLTAPRAIRLLRPVASALAAAHRRGLVHRDVKPGNVLIAREDEHVYLTDFGIARRTDGESMTRTGVLVGTIDYTAPERIEGGRGTPASDVYSFGCMLFETLTGHIPFAKPHEIAKMYAHMSEPVPPLADDAPDVPAALERIVAGAMAKRPEDRPTAAELVTAMDAALGDERRETPAVPRVPEFPATVILPTSEAERLPTWPTAPPASVEPDPMPAAPPPPPSVVPEPVPAPPRHTAPTESVSASGRGRWAFPGAVAALVVIGLVIAIIAFNGRGGGSGSSTSTGSTSPKAGVGTPVVVQGAPGVARKPPIRLTTAPTAIVADGDQAWVGGAGQLARVGSGGAPTTTLPTTGTPTAIALDRQGRIWATGIGATGMTVYDPATRQGNATPAGPSPSLIAIDNSAAWVAQKGGRTVTRAPLDLSSPQTFTVGGTIAAINRSNSRAWVALQAGGLVVLNDDGTVGVPRGPAIPGGTVGITNSNGVWFLSSSRLLTRVDPRADHAVGGLYAIHTNQAPVGPDPVGIGALAGDNSIWVLSAGDKTLTRIGTNPQNPDNNKVIARVQFPVTPGALAVGNHVLWVTIPSTKQIYPITFR